MFTQVKKMVLNYKAKITNIEESDENELLSSRVKDSKDLENIFSEILEKFPEDLKELRGNCSFKNKMSDIS